MYKGDNKIYTLQNFVYNFMSLHKSNIVWLLPE